MKMKKGTILIVIILSISTFIEVKDLNKYTNNRHINQNLEEENEDLNLILVNKKNELDSNYEPKNMIKPNIPFLEGCSDEDMHMVEGAGKAIEALFKGAKEDGIEFIGTSAYRSYKSQKKVYNQNVRTRGIEEAKKYAAQPGKSEHQTGLSIDLTNEQRWFHKSTKEAIWLSENAHKFGFILRYLEDKEDITGYNFEPWHVRYVGKDIAKEIFKEGITLEEYLENKQV